MNSAQTVKSELRNQFLHQSWPDNRVMLSQSSSSLKIPHPGLPYCTYFIGTEYSYCGTFWRPTKAVTVGKKQPWGSAPSWRLHQEVHAWFSSFQWTFCPAAHPLYLCLPGSRIRIWHSPPVPKGTMCDRPQCPVPLADSAAGCYKSTLQMRVQK